MASIFGILAAVVLTLSAWIGYRNHVEYKNLIDDRQKQEGVVVNKQNELSDVTGKYNDEVTLKSKWVSDNEEKSKELVDTETKLKGLEKDLESKDELLKANVAKLEAQRKSLEGLPDPDVLIPQITATQNEIAKLKVDIDELKANVANLEDNKSKTASVIVAKKKVNDERVAGKSLSTLNTTISSVYRGWGFVTLNGGDQQGVTPDSTLDVIRNGEVIGKLKVTAVEANKAAADILLNDDDSFVSLRSGDRVVAELDKSKLVQPEVTAAQ